MKNISTHTCNNKNTMEFIRHEYPKDGEYHPFDTQTKLNYFIYADGFSYLMKQEDLKDSFNILKIIPKAYLPYFICERAFMISKGNINWENCKLNENDNYCILCLHKIKNKENLYTHKIESTNNVKYDISIILEQSKLEDENVYLFAKIIE